MAHPQESRDRDTQGTQGTTAPSGTQKHERRAYRRLASLREEWGPLPRRVIHVLLRAGVTPGRLRAMSDWELLSADGVGRQTFAQIRAVHPTPLTPPPPRPGHRTRLSNDTERSG